MIRRWDLLMALSMAACTPTAPAPTGTAHTPNAVAVCRVAPDDGPVVVADRGIGGTGIDHAGTGTAGTETADRGIGGTGIIGVVTGFASICVDGLEVGYDRTTPVTIAGDPATIEALRAGQVVAITATDSGTGLRASSVAVRYEVVGPVDAVVASDVLTVAGQHVVLDDGIRGEAAPHSGEWVAVSGIRRPEGAVMATRIDRATPGRITVRGRLDAGGEDLRVGGLIVRPTLGPRPTRGQPARGQPAPGQYITASGVQEGGALLADVLVPDLLMSDPPAYFGSDTRRFFVESFVRTTDGRALTTGGFSALLGGDVGSTSLGRAPVRAVLALRRDHDAAVVTSVHLAPANATNQQPVTPADFDRGAQPAPVPHTMNPRGDQPASSLGRNRPGGGPAAPGSEVGGIMVPGANGNNPAGFGPASPGSGAMGPPPGRGP